MNTTDIISMFGVASDDKRMHNLFQELNTLHRPQRPDFSNSMFYDWILVRRHGLELGFVDEEFQACHQPLSLGAWKMGSCAGLLLFRQP